MTASTRDGRLAAAFVTLADTLVDDYDVVDLLQELVDACADLFGASAAGVLIADPAGVLEVVASTSEDNRLVNLMQPRNGTGPCIESYETGTVVAIPDISQLDDEWPEFRAESDALGFRSVHAVPLRLRGVTIGTLGIFRDEPGLLDLEDSSIIRGLADVATIGILHERAIRESDIAMEQLQNALNSRVIIEQAKGVIAQLRDVGMDEAFGRLRAYARSNNLILRDVAGLVVSRELDL
ncbi:MAG: hypothetical protein JWQ12_2111 [Glaciihabitans sp.]|jgi:GAF domain-containing protein|nr:hypothetical protein [Glaciihabitans sp.]